MRSYTTIFTLILTFTLLSACGVKGDLELPPIEATTASKTGEQPNVQPSTTDDDTIDQINKTD